MKTPILGSSYVARSVNAANARMVNLFPEIVPEAGKEPAFLNRAPGLKLEFTAGFGPIRGLWVLGSNLYVVSGTQLYKVTPAYVVTLIGSVTGTGPVSMADNGTQLFVACNGPSYIYNSLTDVFQQITDPDFPGAVTVGYLDGYFVFNEPNSQKIWVTALLEGTLVDPLDFASAEGSPDGVVGIIVDHGQLWVYGTNSIEVWYNSGNPDFPFERIQGAFNELGCAAAYSLAKMDNGLFWLGKDARGQGMVYRANGYSGQRISTHAIEWHIQQYGDLSDAIGYTYQQDGHSFYVLIFPTADTTWVYDVATQAWHERAGFANGEFTRHRSNCQAFFGTKVLVGDYQNANIYSFDLDDFSDNGSIQKWLRSWRALPTGQNNLKRTAHHSLQLDCETGVGLNLGQGSDPEVMLRWSDDGGHTWSNEHWVSIGKIGEYYRRAIWRRLGMTLKLRDRVYEVSGTDPVKIAIMGAELMISPTNA
ncbi:packaged DNA stabilization protein [Phage DSL-LC05]|nr:packaged DNA stabilization protein [Phage DSL-LC05]